MLNVDLRQGGILFNVISIQFSFQVSAPADRDGLAVDQSRSWSPTLLWLAVACGRLFYLDYLLKLNRRCKAT